MVEIMNNQYYNDIIKFAVLDITTDEYGTAAYNNITTDLSNLGIKATIINISSTDPNIGIFYQHKQGIRVFRVSTEANIAYIKNTKINLFISYV